MGGDIERGGSSDWRCLRRRSKKRTALTREANSNVPPTAIPAMDALLSTGLLTTSVLITDELERPSAELAVREVEDPSSSWALADLLSVAMGVREDGAVCGEVSSIDDASSVDEVSSRDDVSSMDELSTWVAPIKVLVDVRVERTVLVCFSSAHATITD